MIEIRAATADDAEQIAKVHVAVWREAYRGVMPDAYLDGLRPEARAPAWREQIADPEARTRTFVAERDGEVVGFFVCGPARLPAPDDHGEMHAINILVTAQHQGLGKRMVAETARTLLQMGYGAMTLSVIRDNAAGRMFYESLGGRLHGRHEDQFEGFSLPCVEYRWADLRTLAD
ncbi:MAG: GNAT family N-acetyltransferase [Phenylobacterium sp.]